MLMFSVLDRVFVKMIVDRFFSTICAMSRITRAPVQPEGG